jgi:Holliday junction resolvasome RuvABC endonuclease subunit
VIIALDIATTTGVAVGEPGCKPRAWSFKIEGKTQADRFADLSRLIGGLFKTYSVDQVGFEAPFVGRNPPVAKALFGYRAIVMMHASLKLLPSSEVDVATIRKHFLGSAGFRGPEAKTLTMQRCAELGWNAADDNAADALALWDLLATRASPHHGHTTMRLFSDGKNQNRR